MTLRHLKTFIVVAEKGSITKAAEELSVAQPSVSQTIKELESFYKIILFDRLNKRIVLTDEGKILLQKAKEVIDSYGDFEKLALEANSNPIIKIGCSLSIGKVHGPKILDVLKENYPNITPYLYIDKTTVIEQKLLKGDLDFALVEGLIQSKDILSFPLRKSELSIFAAPDYKIPDTIKLKDLNNYPLFLSEEANANRALLNRELFSLGISLTPTMESISTLAILECIKRGLGITVLPTNLLEKSIKEGELKLIKFEKPIIRNKFIIKHKSKRFTSIETKVFNDIKMLLI